MRGGWGNANTLISVFVSDVQFKNRVHYHECVWITVQFNETVSPMVQHTFYCMFMPLCRQWNMLLADRSCRSYRPWEWHHWCISISSGHTGQTCRLWADDRLMWRDRPTFLSTRTLSTNKICPLDTQTHGDMQGANSELSGLLNNT